ncbi:hypothetical protein C8J57DRAFT_1714385 [Mycena rebaudengoi]|nr:hypothetical protein C8J57DRAFT_1714385 [Mycena rebaudengoi]
MPPTDFSSIRASFAPISTHQRRSSTPRPPRSQEHLAHTHDDSAYTPTHLSPLAEKACPACRLLQCRCATRFGYHHQLHFPVPGRVAREQPSGLSNLARRVVFVDWVGCDWRWVEWVNSTRGFSILPRYRVRGRQVRPPQSQHLLLHYIAIPFLPIRSVANGAALGTPSLISFYLHGCVDRIPMGSGILVWELESSFGRDPIGDGIPPSLPAVPELFLAHTGICWYSTRLAAPRLEWKAGLGNILPLATTRSLRAHLQSPLQFSRQNGSLIDHRGSLQSQSFLHGLFLTSQWSSILSSFSSTGADFHHPSCACANPIRTQSLPPLLISFQLGNESLDSSTMGSQCMFGGYMSSIGWRWDVGFIRRGWGCDPWIRFLITR